MSNSGPTAKTTRGSLGKKDYEVLAAFRYSLRKFLHFSESVAQEKGLSAQQHQALLVIKGFPEREEITVGELAEQLQIRHHSAVGLADRLVEQRLIQRLPSRSDRRRVFLKMTPRGSILLRQLSLAHREELRRLTPGFKALLRNLDVPKS